MSRRRLFAVALSYGLVVAAVPSFALDQRDFKNCDQSVDWDLKIAGCTKMLQVPKLPPEALSAIYAARGTGFAAKNDFSRAIVDFDEALRLNSKSIAALNNRGAAWLLKGENAKAIADLDAAVALDPKNPSIFSARGTLWRQLGEYNKSIADLNEAITLAPKVSQAYNNRALTWKDAGEYDRAIADLNEAIRLNPADEKAYGNRGNLWRLEGDLEQALIDLNTQIRLHPKDSIGLTLRGDTYRYKGELDHALADYNAALKIEPDAVAIFTGRGLTYEKAGDLTHAREDFRKALTSSEQSKIDDNRTSLETARSRLAAYDSGDAQPTIPAAPARAASETSIPTPVAAAPILTKPVAATAIAKQGRRIALVIGNSAYKNVPALTNPQKDANAIATSLRNVGFDTVTLAVDATREKLIDSLRAFADEAEKADWAIVYYAGHGIEVNGQNYLIPTDAKLASDRDVQFEAIPLDQVMASLEGAKKLKLVLLDACRDNPFAPQMRRTAPPAPAVVVATSTAGGTVSSRSIGRGLGEVKVTGASLVVFAAKHGETALDGEGGNSPFAVAMVQRIATPGVEINKIFRLVRDDVMEATAGRQEPYTYGSLPGKEDFFFVAAK
ncbi:caspase family protein [Bradyrhizobium sp. dw_411]|uniref:caspase family protein n=1 Tax=Bradyrhizobium sp. dw_411 TaxID=2720082 RepID=UPI001BCBC323|nr:caspase family protein [Bradyrhizobium sp. dw_411]